MERTYQILWERVVISMTIFHVGLKNGTDVLKTGCVDLPSSRWLNNIHKHDADPQRTVMKCVFHQILELVAKLENFKGCEMFSLLREEFSMESLFFQTLP